MLGGVHRVLYINLDRRVDRRREIEAELARADVPAFKIERLAATAHANPFSGCATSHARAMQHAMDAKWPNVLVLEDDFVWNDSKQADRLVQTFFTRPYAKTFDVVQFAHHVYESTPVDDLVCRVTHSTNLGGYLVSERAYAALARVWEEAGRELDKHPGLDWKYAADLAWRPLQKTREFYAFHERLGHQRPGYSDLRGRFMDYGGE